MRYQITPIQEWINNPYYSGILAKSLYPYWKQKLVQLFSPPAIKGEVVTTGAMRSGKSFFFKSAIQRILYEALSFDSFMEEVFSMSPTTKVGIGYFTYAKEKARDDEISALNAIWDSIKFYDDIGIRRRNILTRLEVENFVVSPGEGLLDSYGKDMLAFVFDEASIRITTPDNKEFDARDLYFELRSRSKSQFSVKGKYLGMSFMGCTAGTSRDFVDKEAVKLVASPKEDTLLIRASMFDIRPESFSEEKFEWFTGVKDIEPCFADKPTAQLLHFVSSLSLTYESFKELNPHLFIRVPVSLKDLFEEAPIQSTQKLAGISVEGSLESKFFKKPELLLEMFSDEQSPIMSRIRGYALLDFSMQKETSFEQQIDIEKMFKGYRGEPVFAALDKSKRWDKTGLSFIYRSTTDGKIHDLLLGAAFYSGPAEVDQISVDKVCQFFYWMFVQIRIHFGTLQSIVYDHPSKDYVEQYFMKVFLKIVDYRYLAFDKDDSLADCVRKGLFVKDFCLRVNSLLLKEMKDLEYNAVTRKVDHPTNPSSQGSAQGDVLTIFSKDVFDALSASYYELMLSIKEIYKEEIDEELAKGMRARRMHA